ncbi:GIY-YIG nuclease family protein [Sphingobacterium rhinopitheci]|mgnify:CR=1 FL=1|uniref:GIY-YIG nuclease family protein n=1 Tax=Sphingobacterium rhinopitheci TaxID=2781960 RepID=UPI001F523DAA|nr:GIY-YIG nuclease family protein [Sphingobacterium rhinopitheci]MCI0922628.1 GIY-YIG nuclease family protein [Sphingobacterium rhinopitheci]
MERGGCVYILTNKNKSTLYTGVTSDLQSRIYEHLNKKNINSFTARYNLTSLVYFKFYPTIKEAIAEEKRIKAGNRKNKEKMINDLNPSWIDLFETEVQHW